MAGDSSGLEQTIQAFQTIQTAQSGESIQSDSAFLNGGFVIFGT
jgi:hypothetical protein